MIKSIRITGMESKTYMAQEEIQKYHNIQINYDFNLKDPRIVKSVNSGEEMMIIEYTFAINYINPSMGYIRYTGELHCIDIGAPEKITNQQRLEMTSAVMSNVLPMALLLSRSMGLPPAVPLPMPPTENPDDQIPKREDDKGMYQ